MFLLFLTLSLLAYMFNGYLGFFSQIFIFYYYINKSNRELKLSNVNEILSLLIGLITISIPTSFINIFGGSYGSLPISFFNVFLILTIAYIFYQNKKICIKLTDISKVLVFICAYLLVSIFISINKLAALKDYLTIVTPLILLFLISSIDKLNIKVDILKDVYLQTSLATALTLLIQIILSKVFHYDIGMIGYYGGNRTAYGIIFSDYSFLSLFLTTSSAYYIGRILKHKNHIDILSFIIVTLAAILTTSRTGIAGLIGGIIIFVIYKIVFDNNTNKKTYYKLLPYLMILIFVAILFISKLRPEQNIFSGSGRIKEYILGIKIFLENPIFGIGLGAENYIDYVKNVLKISSKMALPHNFFILIFMQTGVIGGILICLMIYKIIKLLLIKQNDILLLGIFTTIVGCQFIPDILQSRFFVIQMILIILDYKFKEDKKIQNN